MSPRLEGNPPSSSRVDEVTLLNLTPLELLVEGANGVRWPLEPLAKVQAKRPPDLKFGVSHKGVRLRGLEVHANATELKIDPGLFASAGPPPPPVSAPGTISMQNAPTVSSASLLNRANVEVDIFWVDPAGQPIKKLTLAPDTGLVPDWWPQGYVSGIFGDVFVARCAATGDILATLVIGTGEERLTITGDFRGRSAALTAGAAAQPSAGAVDVINLTPIEFDLEDAAGGRWHLQPRQWVRVARPPASKFAVKVHGICVATPGIGAEAGRLEIVPGMFVSAQPTPAVPHPQTGTMANMFLGGTAGVLNRTGEVVDIFAVDHSGKETKKLSLHSDPRMQGFQTVQGSLGDVHVARWAATGVAMGMFVLKEGGQQVTLSGEFAVVNLTPLALSIEWAGRGPWPLWPFDQVNVRRPDDLKFVVSDANRQHGLGELKVGPLANDLKIVPTMLTPAGPRSPVSAPGTGRIALVNKAGVKVDVLRVDSRGQEIKTCTIDSEPTPHPRVVAGNIGELHAVRATATGDVLAMFLLEGASELTITGDFRARLAGLVRGPAYDLLETTHPLPDSRDGKYVRHCAQDLGTAKLNGWIRLTRRVTICGLELVLDSIDRYSLIKEYCNQEDIAEVHILANTVVIRTGLRFPQADVSIFARELRFEGAAAFIDTRPLDSKYRDPSKIDGDNGANAGVISLFVETFESDPSKSATEPKHLRATGGTGQDPDEGGYYVSTDRKHLKVITAADWDALFSYKNRRIDHEKMLGGQLYVDTLPYPSWDEINKLCHNSIVYVELKNKYYKDTGHNNVSSPELIGSIGVAQWPGNGGAAKTPGTPGTGGAGGTIRSNRPIPPAICNLSGGPSGKRHMGVAGEPGGTPAIAYHIFYLGYPDGASHYMSRNIESYLASPGSSSGPGPEPRSPTGAPGSVVTVPNTEYAWAVPNLVNVVLQYAKDCVATGHSYTARAYLSPYKAVLDLHPGVVEAIEDRLYEPLGLSAEVLGDSAALQQLHAEINRLIEQSKGYVDAFGNPPGWVPSLSLESAADLYKNVLNSSLQEIYSSYYLEKIWNRKSEKAEALKTLITALTAQTKSARTTLVNTRTKVEPAMHELAGLLKQIDDLAKELTKREQELRNQADYKTMAKEQKDAIAAGFKIGGAVLKALPLPEPFQAVSGGVGTLLDVTSTFIENGGDDAAFTNLKTQVDAFTADADLTNKLSRDIDDDLAENNQETTELEARTGEYKKHQAAVERAAASRVTELENEKILAEKAAALQAAKLALQRADEATAKKVLSDYEASLSAPKGKPEDPARAQQKAALAALDVKLTKAGRAGLQDKIDNAALDQELTKIKQGLEPTKTKLKEGAAALDGEKSKLDQAKKALDAKKKDRATVIKTRVQQLKNITAGIATIGQTINKLVVSQSQLNSAYDKALSNLQQTDGKFLSLMSQASYLAHLKTEVIKKIAQLDTTLRDNQQLIAKNMVVINLLRAQKAKSAGVLDPSALAYIQSLGQDAHRDLRTFLYYVVKAYEYYTVRPWNQSYLTAQETFEALRKVLEPSDFSFDLGSDVSEDQKKKIQSLLKEPENQKDGILQAAEFALLKLVYQKPLRDMGTKLATELMKGSGKLLNTTKPVSLSAEHLQELNDRLQDSKRHNAISFNLLKLREIEFSRERQRIKNIRVVAVRCQKLDTELPSQILFKFSLVGKSIVRARNRLFAFDPEVGQGDDGVALPGLTFETGGGQSETAGWTKDPESPQNHDLLGAALWQPNNNPQANLLSDLMTDYSDTAASGQLKTISQFRPGMFSDFVLTVDLSPAGRKVKFIELRLALDIETGDTNLASVFVSVDNNRGIEVPITASKKDHSGRDGGTGTYVGFYDALTNLAEDPIRFTVPATYGRYRHVGWLVDGNLSSERANTIDVSKSSYLTALYD